MKKANIFLLDPDPAGGTGRTLLGLIESFPNLNIQLPHEPIKPSEFFLRDCDLPGITSGCNPDVIVLILSQCHLKHTGPFFQSLNGEFSGVPIIVAVKECQPDEIFLLLNLGVADFITPPFKAIDILPRLWRLLKRKQQEQTLTHKLQEKLGLKQLVGQSPAFLEEVNKIPIVAKADVGVLISGETGTGKELFARAIHYLSPRASKPFVPFNCGAIPTDLMENELFGHVQGAFTGASASQPGLIRETDSGTPFLDDIDCLPLLSQAKLLRFLQEKEYRQLGSSKTLQADVRVITATNIDLEDAVNEGKLRRVFYYRLNIVPLLLPPLRDRREDIPLLTRHFLEKYAIKFNKQVVDFTLDSMKKLVLHEWPGNVRELEHIIERAVLFTENTIIRENDITLARQKVTPHQESFKEAKTSIIHKFEKDYINAILLTYQGNITKAAQAA